MSKIDFEKVFEMMSTKDLPLPEASIPLESGYKSEVNDKVANLFIYGPIGSYYWDGVSAKSVKNFLQDLNVDEINVYIHSRGGDFFEGLAIRNQLKAHSAKVNAYIDGLAASAASLITTGADNIYMPKTSMKMIHNVWVFAAGNAKELRKSADDIEKMSGVAISAYMERFKGTEEELKALLDDETFMTADEAVALGFADEIIEKIEITSPVANGPDDEEDDEEETPLAASALQRMMQKYAAEVQSEPDTTKKNLLSRFSSTAK
ncbi:hypothetical protein CF394_11290 [Tetzosporium hominis]|uniref:ATP-dependent Clp protease proteolytic subunit n=1 Tax=Tetzosporium hominis TaxID=2020506 RepID=A0A264W1I7_9BACL|nr:head maturation protease, ClpP-related [Tetzosporium hominis]OZS77458.1 hypothetical protein CF394_11290 [Tetzosporium hominis]